MAGPARFCGNFLVVSAFTTSLYANFLAYPFLFAVILLAVAVLFAINVFLARYPRFSERIIYCNIYLGQEN